jgi:hypothetical protein
MMYFVVLALCLARLSYADHHVVVMGSSYAFGDGLTGWKSSGVIPDEVQNYGYKLAQKLGTLNTNSFVHNLAQSGSVLNGVAAQAGNIPDTTTLIAVTSGGNDLNYLGCLGDNADHGTASTCVSPPSGMTEVKSCIWSEILLTIIQTTWQNSFVNALTTVMDAITTGPNKVANPFAVPIYIVTYTRVLASYTIFGPNQPAVPLTGGQFLMNAVTYETLINWMLNAYNALKADAKYGQYNLRMVPMRQYSSPNHALNGTGQNWVNSHYPELNADGTGRDGAAFHPNEACHEWISEYILNDLNGWGVPAY